MLGFYSDKRKYGTVSDNIVQLRGWEIINENNWRKLKELDVYETEPIYFTKCALFKKTVKLNLYFIKIRS